MSFQSIGHDLSISIGHNLVDPSIVSQHIPYIHNIAHISKNVVPFSFGRNYFVQVMAKHTKPQYVRSQLPYKLFVDSIENEGCKRKLPKAFNWASLNTDSLELKLYFGDDSEYDEYNEYDDDDNFHNTAGGGDLTQHQGGTKASYITKSMNQNLPTYCGSGWAHAAVSVLADRIKMIRMIYMADDDEEEDDDDYIHGNLPDVSLSVQFLLNCGGEIAGSCHGGSFNETFIDLYTDLCMQLFALFISKFIVIH